MECLEIVVVCGYGRIGYLNKIRFRKFSICKDGCLVCFLDIWWWIEVVGEKWVVNKSSFFIVCDIIDVVFVKLLFKRSSLKFFFIKWIFIYNSFWMLSYILFRLVKLSFLYVSVKKMI